MKQAQNRSHSRISVKLCICFLGGPLNVLKSNVIADVVNCQTLSSSLKQ